MFWISTAIVTAAAPTIPAPTTTVRTVRLKIGFVRRARRRWSGKSTTPTEAARTETPIRGQKTAAAARTIPITITQIVQWGRAAGAFMPDPVATGRICLPERADRQVYTVYRQNLIPMCGECFFARERFYR